MKITNKHNLPQAFVNACTPREPMPDRFSVTEIIGPAMISQLRRKHYSELEEDVADRLWAIMGSGMHGVLQEHGARDELTEERLAVPLEIDGRTVTLAGMADTYSEGGIISDYKFTTVYAHGDPKPEWAAQLNCYAWLYRQHGFAVNGLQIIAIYRDWSKRHAAQDIPHLCVTPVALWDDTTTEAYIRDRLTAMLQPNPPICTPEERWRRPDTWAVMKKGRKTALKLCDNESEAQGRLGVMGGTHIDFRPGEDVRCQSYCPVKAFCEYGQSINTKKEN